jgi:hypothetical protein
MADDRGITRYELMPIAPVEEHTEYFDAGAVVFGVEYRLLDSAIAAASRVEEADGSDPGVSDAVDDRGVSIHVFGVEGGERVERLRFDCFDEDPHYHYVSWSARSNEMIHIDPVVEGDPLAWALERIRTRLPQMLVRAGAGEVAGCVEPARIEAVLPLVTEAAYRARFHHDDDSIRRGALSGSGS